MTATAARHKPTRKWNEVLLKAFGGIHIVFGAYGFYLVAFTVFRLISSGRFAQPRHASTPFAIEAFFVMTFINLLFLVVLVIAGIFLLRARLQGVRMSNALFVAMIAYAIALTCMSVYGGNIGLSIAAATGIGNMGIAPQVVTAYPIIALVALNLVRRKLKAARSQAPPLTGIPAGQ